MGADAQGKQGMLMKKSVYMLVQVARVITALLSVFWVISMLNVVMALAEGKTTLDSFVAAVVITALPCVAYYKLTAMVEREKRRRSEA